MDEQNSTPNNLPGDLNPAQAPEKKTHWGVLISVAIVLLLLVGGVIFGGSYLNRVSTLPAYDIDGLDLEGTLYMSMAPRGNWHVDLYTLDLASGELKKDPEEGYIRYTGVLSNTTNEFAFFGLAYDDLSIPPSEFMDTHPHGLFVRNLDSGEVKYEMFAELRAMRAPMWSPDDRYIAFTALAPENLTIVPEPDGWQVLVYDTLTSELTVISEGTYPMWSPDGSGLLFLRNDGLYFADIATQSSDRVLASAGTTSVSMKLGISKARDKLAWTTRTLTAGSISLFDLSWDGGTVIIEGDRKVEREGQAFFWPVFSGEGDYIVVQAINTDSASEPRLVILDLDTDEMIDTFSLRDYNFNINFLSDWR